MKSSLNLRRPDPCRAGAARVALVVLCAGANAACQDSGGGAKGSTTLWSPAGYEQIPLGIPRDLDPDPNRIEVVIESRPAQIALRAGGPEITMWTYDGLIPGPLIRAKRGDKLTVRFRNSLPDSSTIHWHGVRVPNPMDGSHVTQAHVSPGGEFVYAFDLVDAGTFWYHPHHQSNKQVGFGLYGPLVVDARDEPPGLGSPAIIVLSDVTLDASGKLAPYDEGGIEAGKRGREGSIVLVNGRTRPTVTVPINSRQRWLLVNASRNRFFRIALQGHALTRIGGDGGFLEQPLADLPDLMLGPGERGDVVFIPTGTPGARILVSLLPYDRGNGSGDAMADAVALMDLSLAPPSDSNAVPPALPAQLRSIERLAPTLDSPVDELAIGETPTGFVVNGQAFNGDMRLPAKVGELRVFDLINHTIYDHPFHLHGFFFQVLAPNTFTP
ncbi:MAG: multicopper oxidase family protein, partial [Deltaproteobacteria bacterium]|nr:multicopper oxidase family protein [Deltaproteobacteria bacterium]